MSMYDPIFIDLLRKYKKILKLRNIELKNERKSIIEILDNQLAETGLEIQKKRTTAIYEFNNTFSSIFREISGLAEDIHIKYEPSWDNIDTVEQAMHKLNRNYKRDIIMGSTTTGPHRDKFEYYINNYDFAKIASTGQLRLISLVMRITQSIFISKKHPVNLFFFLMMYFLNLTQAEEKSFSSFFLTMNRHFYFSSRRTGLSKYQYGCKYI